MVYATCSVPEEAGRRDWASSRDSASVEESRDHDQGWGAIMQRLGITTDSPQFERLKRGVADSYQRWGRPLPGAGAAMPVVKDVSRRPAAAPQEPPQPSKPA